MKLYLLRHAEAVSRDSEDIPDDYRVLSTCGREVVKKVGRWCVDQQIQVEQIVSSPLIRAVQTAEILSGIIHPAKDVEIALPLMAGGAVGQVMRFLPLHQHLKSLLLIGHEPAIGMTVSALLDLEKKVSFSPGAMCCCTYHGTDRMPQASFEWMLQPLSDAKTKTVTLKTISSIEMLL